MGQHNTAQIDSSSRKASIAFDYGEIVEILEELGRLRVEWKIPGFLSLREEIHKAVFSPTFNFLEADYHLGILPFSDTNSKTSCKVRLFLGDSKKPDICSIGIRQVDGTVDKSCGRDSGVASFSRDELLKKQSKWLSSDVLTVALEMMDVLTVALEMQSTAASEGKSPAERSPEAECSSTRVKMPTEKEPEVEVLWDSKKVKAKEPEPICISDDSDAEDDAETNDRTHDSGEMRLRLTNLLGFNFDSKGTQTEDMPSVDKDKTEHERLEAKSISKLTKHLGDLLLEGRDHDVTIKVKNRAFKAHKALLGARSPVFASMFRHEMEESASGEVSIKDCDPDVFDLFLKHVYTGKFQMDSAKSAIALHYVADKYDFQELKEACVRYLSNSFSTTTVCDVIKMAAVHGEKVLLQKASLFFERNLEEILTTVEWQIFLQVNTTMANEMLIQAVTRRSETPQEKKISVSLDCPSCSVKRT